MFCLRDQNEICWAQQTYRTSLTLFTPYVEIKPPSFVSEAHNILQERFPENFFFLSVRFPDIHKYRAQNSCTPLSFMQTLSGYPSVPVPPVRL